MSLAGSQSPSSTVVPPTRPSKIHRRNEHGETIVHIAARKGDLKQLKKVLKAGANVNEADNAGKRQRVTCLPQDDSNVIFIQVGHHCMKVNILD